MNEGTFIIGLLLAGIVIFLIALSTLMSNKHFYLKMALILLIQFIILPFSGWFASVLYLTILATIFIMIRSYWKNKNKNVSQ